MHRTQILLEDGQYARLRELSRATGTGIGELVRRAVSQAYGYPATEDKLRALDDSFGAALDSDFDGTDGEHYVDRHRRGLGQKMHDLSVE